MNISRRNSSPQQLERLDGVIRLVQALDENLCILDTETTGLARDAGVAELAYLWFGKDGQTEAFSCLLNPQEPIPEQATRVHGISDEMVANAPTYDAVAKGVSFIFDNAVLSGFNVRSYDMGILLNANARYGEPTRAPDILDVRDIWRGMRRTAKGTLTYLADYYDVEAGPAHEGMGDVITTARVLNEMVLRYGVEDMFDYLYINRPERKNAIGYR